MTPIRHRMMPSYEMAERTWAIGFGGVGAIHEMVRRLKLDEAINESVPLLKIHAPYYESDHVLNMAYNVLTDGTSIDNLERLRNNETYMNGIGPSGFPIRRPPAISPAGSTSR